MGDSGESAATLSLRVRTDQKRLMERAAGIKGKSLTDFVVGAATARAVQVVQEHRVWVLSEQAFDAFVAALDDPPPPNEALRRAMARYRECPI